MLHWWVGARIRHRFRIAGRSGRRQAALPSPYLFGRDRPRGDAFGADLRLGISSSKWGQDRKTSKILRAGISLLRINCSSLAFEGDAAADYFEKIPELFRPYCDAPLWAARLIMRFSLLLVTKGLDSSFSPSGFGRISASGFGLSG
jgi:hypothetical protein